MKTQRIRKCWECNSLLVVAYIYKDARVLNFCVPHIKNQVAKKQRNLKHWDGYTFVYLYTTIPELELLL